MRRHPKFVSEFRDRHGNIRVRFRRTGYASYYFKARFPSEEWWKEYNACLEGKAAPKVEPGRDRVIPGSINDLVSRYYGSADWQRPNAETRSKMQSIIDRFRAGDLGNVPARDFGYPHASAVLAAMANRPHAANRLRKLMRRVFDEGLRLGMVEKNPWALTRPFPEKGTGFHQWNDTEIAQFRSHWPIGTKQRLAMELMLCWAQRGGDVRELGPQHIQAGEIVFTQSKTRRPMRLEILPTLRVVIDATPSGHLNFIVTAFGKPFTRRGFGQWFARACDAAGLNHCRAHGLRKAGARLMAEAGATDREIMAVTGHQSHAEVSRYTKAAEQGQLASNALHKVANLGDGVAKNTAKSLKRGQ